MKRAGAWGAAILAAVLQAGAAWGWEDYPGLQGPGHAGVAIGDFDGDGTPEAAVSAKPWLDFYGNAGSQLLAVLKADGAGTLGIRTISMLPTPLIGSLVPAPRQGGADRLAAVAGDGSNNNQILILGGVPLRILRTIEIPLVQRVAAIADVDSDGRFEIVALTGYSSWDTYPVVLDYETGAVKWTGPDLATDVGVAQLDGDAALELILSGTPGRIVDGATHAVEWTYPSGFGDRIVVGHFDVDAAVAGFATLSPWSIRIQVFRAQPYSPVSEFNLDDYASAADVVRLTPEGPDEIAVGTWRSTAVYDPRSGERLIEIPNSYSYPPTGLAAGDLRGAGHTELVSGSQYGLLRAVNLATLADDFAQVGETGPYAALASGILDGSGSERIAYLTTGSSDDSLSPTLRVLDAASGQRLRERAHAVHAWYGPPHIALAPIGGERNAIVVAGSYAGGGELAVLDGMSLMDRWRVGGHDSVLTSAMVRAMATIDANGDGTPDVVVATDAARVVVLDGRDGTLLWQSVTLDGGTPPSLAAFRTPAGAPRVAVARGAALYVFDPASHLLVSTTKTAAGVIGLWQWGDGDACRLGALDERAVVTIHRCDNLGVEAQRLMPEGTVFFRPADAEGSRFVAASGAYLYEVDATGGSNVMAGPLGNQLGADNQGIVRADPDGEHFDVIIGSDYLVTRKRVGIVDPVFANGFD